MNAKKILLLIATAILTTNSFAQCPGALTQAWEQPVSLPHETMTCLHDRNGKTFLYVAGKEQGLLIYNISNINLPVLALTIPADSLGGLDVCSVWQEGNYLYLALGNQFSSNQHSGMAIVDVTQPATAQVTDVWQNNINGGGGIVRVQGNYAFLGAMTNGLIIFNISNPNNIQFVSQLIPDLSFPTANPDTAKYNARGMDIVGDILYLCFDAGGLRIINIHDKLNPVETGHYSLPFLNTHPRAYNNIIVDGALAYVAIDYCGLEILNVSDTSNITQTGWWNPWDCATVNNNWFNSRGHANELRLVKNCDLIFLTTGKSQVNVVDVSNSAAPDSCTMFGTQLDTLGTWGLDVWGSHIFVAYIYSPFGIPFLSNWAGVKMIEWDNSCDVSTQELAVGNKQLAVYPNPASEKLIVSSTKSAVCIIEITDLLGRKIHSEKTNSQLSIINCQLFPPGIYFVYVKMADGSFHSEKFVKE